MQSVRIFKQALRQPGYPLRGTTAFQISNREVNDPTKRTVANASDLYALPFEKR